MKLNESEMYENSAINGALNGERLTNGGLEEKCNEENFVWKKQ